MEQPPSRFTFVTDAETEKYCKMIAGHMVSWFGISEAEAVGRINRQFHGSVVVGSDLWFYHEMPKDWAGFIYYESGVYWWVAGADLRPKPYP